MNCGKPPVGMKASRVGVGGHEVLELLHGSREVVIRVERAAFCLGPATLAGQAIARRGGGLGARQLVADALHALVVVGRRGAAGLDADGAAIGLDRLGELGEVGADLVVVGADIGHAEILVLGQQVGVPGQNRDAGFLGGLQRNRHGGRVRRRHGDAIHLLGHEVLDDRDLFVTAAMLAGADVHALESAVGFGFGLLAAVAGLVEERVVHVLRHKREDVLRLGAGGRDRQGADGKDRAS